MRIKFFLNATSLFFFCFYCNSQQTFRALYSLTISKSINDENNRKDKYVEVDSRGNIYLAGNKIDKKINIRRFSREISMYVIKERIDKYPGNNDITVTEGPIPKLNAQTILISVMFLDDFYKEKKLRNKTYYSWGDSLAKNIKDYSLFKYLTQHEVELFKQ